MGGVLGTHSEGIIDKVVETARTNEFGVLSEVHGGDDVGDVFCRDRETQGKSL